MIAFGIILSTVGITLSILSIFICFGKINLLHDYHRNNIKEEDIKSFSISTGLSLLIGGVGLTTTGVLALILKDSISVIVYDALLFGSILISFILALIFIKKYNGKIMG